MGKINVLLAMMFALAITTAPPAHAIKIISHGEYDTCSHSEFSFVVDTPAYNLFVLTYFGDGTSVSTQMWGPGHYGQTVHSYLLSGIYTVKHVLLYLGTPYGRIDSVTFSDTAVCKNGYFTGYLDLNSNCVRDASEPPLTPPVSI